MSNLNRPLIRFTQYSDSWKLRPLSELIASVDSGWSLNVMTVLPLRASGEC